MTEDWLGVRIPLVGEKYGVSTIVQFMGETYKIERLVQPPPEPPYFWLGADAERR